MQKLHIFLIQYRYINYENEKEYLDDIDHVIKYNTTNKLKIKIIINGKKEGIYIEKSIYHTYFINYINNSKYGLYYKIDNDDIIDSDIIDGDINQVVSLFSLKYYYINDKKHMTHYMKHTNKKNNITNISYFVSNYKNNILHGLFYIKKTKLTCEKLKNNSNKLSNKKIRAIKFINNKSYLLYNSIKKI